MFSMELTKQHEGSPQGTDGASAKGSQRKTVFSPEVIAL